MDRAHEGGTEPARLAVVMVTHDSATDLERFLPAQIAAAAELEAPLVVADNDSTDGTLELLRDAEGAGPRPTLVEMGRNAGYAAAVNAGFARVPGRDVMLLNPDVELRAEAVRALAGVLEREPDVGVAAPGLVGEDGEAQPSARRFPSLPAMVGSTGPGRVVPPLRRSYERFIAPSRSPRAHTVDWVIGAAMLIRRAAFDAVGGWDERFFLYIEDTDFCRRCARAGWEVAYVPGVSLRHLYPRASRTTGSFTASWARRSHMAGLARLWSRDPRLLVGLGGVRSRELDPGGQT